MAAGTCIISNGGGVSSCEYILREKEALLYSSNLGNDKKSILNTVKKYDSIEKLGDKDLGIRGRHDARSMKKIILALPNKNTPEENMVLVQKLLSQTGITDYPHLVVLHRGEKDGIINRHAHINFFERKFEKGNSNKNREFNKRGFVHSFRNTYQNIFELTPNSEIRDRVDRIKYQSVQQLQKELSIIKTEYEYERLSESTGKLSEQLDQLSSGKNDRVLETPYSKSGQDNSTDEGKQVGSKRRRLQDIGEAFDKFGKPLSNNQQTTTIKHTSVKKSREQSEPKRNSISKRDFGPKL